MAAELVAVAAAVALVAKVTAVAAAVALVAKVTAVAAVVALVAAVAAATAIARRWLRSPLAALSKWEWASALRATAALREAAPGTPRGIIETADLGTRHGSACRACGAAQTDRTAIRRYGARLGYRRSVQTLLRRVSVGQAVATPGHLLGATRELRRRRRTWPIQAAKRSSLQEKAKAATALAGEPCPGM